MVCAAGFHRKDPEEGKAECKAVLHPPQLVSPLAPSQPLSSSAAPTPPYSWAPSTLLVFVSGFAVSPCSACRSTVLPDGVAAVFSGGGWVGKAMGRKGSTGLAKQREVKCN